MLDGSTSPLPTAEELKKAKAILLWKGDKAVLAEERLKARQVRIAAGGSPDDYKHDVGTGVQAMLEKRAKTAKAKVKERRFIIHPRMREKMYWDMYCGSIILYSVLVIPFRICFNQEVRVTNMKKHETRYNTQPRSLLPPPSSLLPPTLTLQPPL